VIEKSSNANVVISDAFEGGIAMTGPIRFVFTVIWFAIGLAMVGTLKDCTATMMGHAAKAQKQTISYGWWNRQLMKRNMH
jgi:hypothetical protein